MCKHRLDIDDWCPIDGFIEGPNRELDWVVIDEELHTFVNDQASEMGAFLYGPRMYDIIEPLAAPR